MPNYITIPASGIGTNTPNVATDNVDTYHYQYMKLVDGTPGASGYITGTTSNGLLVEVSRINNTVSGVFTVSGVVNVLGTVAVSSIAAGDNNIGNVDIVTMPGVVVEDDPSAGGLNSILIAGIRNDAASVRTSDTGDFGNLSIDSVGRLAITDLGGSISVDDNGSSLTIDNAALSQTGGGTETSALRVTIANNSTGLVSVDDNGSSLTVDDGSTSLTVDASGIFPTRQVTSSSATSTSVSGTITSTTILAANPNRLGASLYNDSSGNLYLKFGATASLSSFGIRIDPFGYYEVPFSYTGIMDGIWSSGVGAARVTEFTF